MNYKFLTVTVLATTMGLFTSCEKYDDTGITSDVSSLQVENAKLKAALAAIELTPGADGADGVNGSDGATGNTGATGIAGVNGESITIVSIETSAEGSLVLFSDGSELFVENGSNGTNGTNGSNGSDGSQGIAGNDGAVGMNGSDGSNGTNGRNSAEFNFQTALVITETASGTVALITSDALGNLFQGQSFGIEIRPLSAQELRIQGRGWIADDARYTLIYTFGIGQNILAGVPQNYSTFENAQRALLNALIAADLLN